MVNNGIVMSMNFRISRLTRGIKSRGCRSRYPVDSCTSQLGRSVEVLGVHLKRRLDQASFFIWQHLVHIEERPWVWRLRRDCWTRRARASAFDAAAEKLLSTGLQGIRGSRRRRVRSGWRSTEFLLQLFNTVAQRLDPLFPGGSDDFAVRGLSLLPAEP